MDALIVDHAYVRGLQPVRQSLRRSCSRHGDDHHSGDDQPTDGSPGSVADLCGLPLYTRRADIRDPPASYKWAVLSGICIGIAEIGYFYLFSGRGLRQTIPTSTAIPITVCGTVVVAFIVSVAFTSEPFGWRQMLGVALVVLGVGVLFTK